ncbi:MAG: glycoside hydrolase family 2 TIM barrel-domain containing protein [Bacteroidaceae bacterium]
MKKLNRFTVSVSLLMACLTGMAQRTDSLLHEGWNFRFSHQVEPHAARPVVIPHTWNAADALNGKIDYKRGIGNYTKTLLVPKDWNGQRVFLRFEGANSVTNLFVGGKHVGEHRGGYGAFIFDITDFLKFGEKNELLVRVNNAEQLDVMPLVGDFNFYGGIYRPIHLLITDKVCISPLNYASSGLFLTQTKVTKECAEVDASFSLYNADELEQNVEVRLRIIDGSRTVCEQRKEVSIAPQTKVQTSEFNISIAKPRLWNSTKSPFLYKAELTLYQGSKEIDRIEQPLGIRSLQFDANNGFFLNGSHVKLHGVCRHQERAEVGNVLTNAQHQEDAFLIRELGANAVRAAHYPQADYFYHLMDSLGIMVWAEIPFVGPGGYADKGFVHQPSFQQNGKEQLRELIRQNYNHPSIVCWGIFNELKETGDNPVAYVKELNQLAHAEDATRPTTSASNQGGALNHITDLIAWNRYDGWYGSTPSTLATFLDRTHKAHPQLRIGISEYGAGASLHQQQEPLTQTNPTSRWHPENWQTYYHIENWKIISARPYVWGSFVWNMFDFGAAHRTEGERIGINDKGLVSHDRKERKDAFYFYKANWNAEPMVYLSERRNTVRTKEVTTIQVFTSCKEVVLSVNGKIMAKAKPDSFHIVHFENVPLQMGENLIEVRAKAKGTMLHDACVWTLKPAP